jgi:hypothetical protein
MPIVIGLGDTAWNDPLNIYGGKPAAAEPPKPRTQLPDVDRADLVKTIIAEAAGEGEQGMTAVAQVIKNRADRRGKSPADVVREPDQFTGYAKPGPQALKAMEDPTIRAKAESILDAVLAGELPDITGEADHYHAKSVNPDWASKMPKTAEVGEHLFYRAETGPDTKKRVPSYNELAGQIGLDGDPFAAVLSGKSEEKTVRAPKGRGIADLLPDEPAPMTGNAGALAFVNPGQDEIQPTFRSVLEGASQDLGRGLTVLSGYRSPQHSVEARKQQPGEHSHGTASDISMKGMSEQERKTLVQSLLSRGAKRFITYSNSPDMLHVDMKDQQGDGRPWFMHDKTNKNLGRAPQWFQEIAASPTPAQAAIESQTANPSQVAGKTIVIDDSFAASDPMGLMAGGNPFADKAAEVKAAKEAEQTQVADQFEQNRIRAFNERNNGDVEARRAELEADSPGRYVEIDEAELPQFQQQWEDENRSGGLAGDTGRILKSGVIGVGQSLMSLSDTIFSKLPGGKALMQASDDIDRWFMGQTLEQRLDASKAQTNASVSPDQADADVKNWWDSERGWFGPAWRDPRSYLRTVGESVPATVVTMAPGGLMARGAYLRTLAATGSERAAAAAAARTATVAGAVLEGTLGGADAAKSVRDRISAIPRDQLLQTETVQALVAGGMTEDEALTALSDDAATKSFAIAGVATGMFGGMGDRALAKILAEGVGGSVAKRMVSGAARGMVAEGLLEEAPQGAAQTVAENIGVRDANPDQDLTEGVGEAVASGIAGGGVMGGGLGAAGGAVSPQRETATSADAPVPEGYRRVARDGSLEPAAEPDPAPAAAAPRGPIGRAVQHAEQQIAERGAAAPADVIPAPVAPGAPAAGAAPAAGGRPQVGATVRIDADGIEPFMGRVDGYEGEEAVVVDSGSGEVYQIPLRNLTQIAKPMETIPDRGPQPINDTIPEFSTDPALEPMAPVGTEVRSEGLPPRSEQKEATERFPSAPTAGQSVIVDDENGGRFVATVQGYENGGTEALVRTEDGKDLQVPVSSLKVSKLTEKQVEAQDLERNPPVEREVGDAGPTSRTLLGKTIVLPDDKHARLFDLGKERQSSKRVMGTSQLDLDKVDPRALKALANEFGISEQAVGQLADDYATRMVRNVRSANSKLPQRMPPVMDNILARWRREVVDADTSPAADETQAWYDRELDYEGRRLAMISANIKRPPKTPWADLSAAMQRKLATVRSEKLAAAEAPTDEDSTEANSVESEARINGEINRYFNAEDDSVPIESLSQEAQDRINSMSKAERLKALETIAFEKGKYEAAELLDEETFRQIYGEGKPGKSAKKAPDAADAPAEQTVDDAANQAATSPTNDLPEPTPAQKEAGNYKVGRITLGGLDISIENPAGSERKGTDKDGKAWSVEMRSHYGYIRRTRGSDGDHVDVFVKPGTDTLEANSPVFIVDQESSDGEFDEHKVMLGFQTQDEAEKAYLANYTKGWELGPVTATRLDNFKDWLNRGWTDEPASNPFNDVFWSPPPTEDEGWRPKDEYGDDYLTETKEQIYKDLLTRISVPKFVEQLSTKRDGMGAAVIEPSGKLYLIRPTHNTNGDHAEFFARMGANKLIDKERGSFVRISSYDAYFGYSTGGDISQAAAATIRALETAAARAGINVLKPANDYKVIGTDKLVSETVMEPTAPAKPAVANEPAADTQPQILQPREKRPDGEAAVGTTSAFRRIPVPKRDAAAPIFTWARETVLERGLKTGNEFIMAIEDDGSVIEFGTTDQPNFVGLNTALAQAASNPDRRLVIVHNHPRNGPVSTADMSMMVLPGIYSVWAIGHNGRESRASLTDKARAALATDGSVHDLTMTMSRLQAAFKDVGNGLRFLLQSSVEAKTITAEQAQEAHHSIVAEVVRRAGIIDLINTQPYTISNIPMLENFIDKAALKLARTILDERRTTPPSDAGFYRPTEPLRHVAELGAVAQDAGIDVGELRGQGGLSEGSPGDYQATAQGRNARRLTGTRRISENSIVEAISGKWTDLNPSVLATVPLNYFVELARPNMTAVKEYMGVKRLMDAYRGDKHAEADAIAGDWLKYMRLGFGKANKAKAQELANLMHESTLAGIDPSLTDDETKAKAGYDILRKRYQALAPAGKELFAKVRDAYRAQADELDQILLDNVRKSQQIAKDQAETRYKQKLEEIRNAKMNPIDRRKAEEDAASRYKSESTKMDWSAKARLTKLRIQFESNRVPAPYFPLGRFGQYYVTAKDVDGSVISFSKFERAADRDRFARDIQRDYPGAAITKGVMKEMSDPRAAMDPRMVAEVEQLLGNAGVDNDVMGAVWARYIETLPELSMRKRYMHRKGTAGYDTDALRVFSSHMFHAAHQMAKLKYGLELQELVNTTFDQAEAADDQTRAMRLANELASRHKWVMNPTGGSVAQTMTSTAFVWFLAASPAAAVLNLTQTFMMGLPILGARFGGLGRASVEVAKASSDLISGKGSVRNANLTREEMAAVDAFYRSGMIDRTQSHDLAGVGDTGVKYSPLRARVMGVMSWAFHNTEVWNREATALAAYRLARKSGQSHLDAIDSAHDLTYRVHFDFSNSSRPRFMQNDFAKVALVFRSYSVNMLYRMFRDIHQSVKGESAQARREARYQLAGVTGMMTLMAGVTGTFGFNLMMAVAGMIFGDDDDPMEFEERFKADVLDILGPELGGVVLKGVPGHYLGVDLTSRIGMPDLWFRSPGQDLQGKEEWQFWLSQALGATAGIGEQWFRGASLVMEGDVARGIEVAAPKFIRDPMKAFRYANEGLQSIRGDELLPAEQIGIHGAVAQAMGISPAVVSETWERSGALKNAEQRVMDDRQRIVNAWAMAAIAGDKEGVAEALDRVKAFNKKPVHSAIPITGDTLKRSIKTRQRNAAKREDGVVIQNEILSQRLRAAMPARIY